MSNLRLFVVPLLFALLLFGCIDLRSREARFCDSMVPVIDKEFGIKTDDYLKWGDDAIDVARVAMLKRRENLSEMYGCEYEARRYVGNYTNSSPKIYDLDEIHIIYGNYTGDNAPLLAEKRLDSEWKLVLSTSYQTGYRGVDYLYYNDEVFDTYSFILINDSSVIEIYYRPEDRDYNVSKAEMESVARQAMSIAKELE